MRARRSGGALLPAFCSRLSSFALASCGGAKKAVASSEEVPARRWRSRQHDTRSTKVVVPLAPAELPRARTQLFEAALHVCRAFIVKAPAAAGCSFCSWSRPMPWRHHHAPPSFFLALRRAHCKGGSPPRLARTSPRLRSWDTERRPAWHRRCLCLCEGAGAQGPSPSGRLSSRARPAAARRGRWRRALSSA